MRDGVLLASEVYLPVGGPAVRHPVVLVRSPYNAGGAGICAGHCEKLAARGYAVVNQDVRGTSRSHGMLQPFHQERDDGYDAVEWAAQRPWSNGKVGLWGASYLGAAALQAAVSRPPHLVAVVAAVTASDYHDHWTYVNGVFDQWFAQSWIAGSLAVDEYRRALLAAGTPWPEVQQQVRERFNETKAALQSADGRQMSSLQFVGESVAPYYAQWLDHPYYDAYWASVDLERQYGDIDVPVLSIGGWFDVFSIGSIRNFVGMRQQGRSAAARAGSRLIMAPMCHNKCNAAVEFEDEISHQIASRTFEISPGWWDYWLKGIGDAPATSPAAQLFVMEFPESGSQGGGYWISADEYPLPRTQRVRFALRSDGKANTANGDGVLDSSAPPSGAPDRFIHDPASPVPALGGNVCCIPKLLAPGVFDQVAVESREDVLVYTSASLTNDLVVIGPVSLTFWAASSAPDTDFIAKLVVVRPDGTAFNVLDRVVNAGLRRGSKLPPSAAKAGQSYEYRLELGDTAAVFKAGYRVRLQLSSSSVPRFARHTPAAPAMQTVLHDTQHPSYLELPVPPAPSRSEGVVAFFGGSE